MAKAKRKRSAVRARAKRPRMAPPELSSSTAPPEPEWHKAFKHLSARAGQFRLPQEMVERFRRRFQQRPTDTTRIDRAIAHGAGIIAASPAPAADQPTMPEKAELQATIIV